MEPKLSFAAVEFTSVFGSIETSSRSSTGFGFVEYTPSTSESILGLEYSEGSDGSAFQKSKGSHRSSPSIESVTSGVNRLSTGIDEFSSYPGSTSWDPNRRLVLLNVNNERVDTHLGKCNNKASERLTKRANEGKICNDYHLNERCWASDCHYSHAPALDSEELVVLRYWARRIPCERKYNCRAIDCWYGHNCIFGSHCKLPRTCRFKDVHHVDKRVVTVYRP